MAGDLGAGAAEAVGVGRVREVEGEAMSTTTAAVVVVRCGRDLSLLLPGQHPLAALEDGCELIGAEAGVEPWRIEEQRRYWPGVAYRWIAALAFALLSAVAVGSSYAWIAKPYAAELETLRPRAELGLLVEQRMNTMTPAERRQLDALMKWKRVAR